MNQTVLASSVTSARELARIRREENERAHAAAHAAALNVMEVIDRISGPLPSSGPRTGTHPAAEKSPMDKKIDELLIRPLPIEQPTDYAPPTHPHPPLHTLARTANAYLPLLMVISALLAGIALGKIL